MRNLRSVLNCVVLAVMVVSVAACGAFKGGEAKYPTGADRASTGGDIYANPDSIFGSDGLSFFTALNGADPNNARAGGIGVNSYLWRASLDTLSFLPLSFADPFGGVIITDWYNLPRNKNERFKVNAYILDKQLRADALRIAVFRQTRQGPEQDWVTAPVADDTERELENTILTKARDLRVAQLGTLSE